MPTVLRVGPYRFFFYSNEGAEPPHVHIEAGGQLAKFWLSPIQMARAGGFSAKDLRAITQIIEQHQQQLLEAWNAYFRP